MNLEQSIANYLRTELDGYGVRNGPARDHNLIPSDCIFVLQTGGDAPLRSFEDDLKYTLVQVYVRAMDYELCYDLAQRVYDLLNRHSFSFEDYYDGEQYSITCEQSNPIWAGRDKLERYRYSINLLVKDLTDVATKMPPIPQPDLMWAARLYDGPLGDPVLQSDVDLGDDHTPIPGAHYITPGTIVADQGKLGVDMVVVSPSGGASPLFWLQQNAIGSQPAFRRTTSPIGSTNSTPRLRDIEDDRTKTQWLHDGSARVTGFVVARRASNFATNHAVIGNASLTGSVKNGFNLYAISTVNLQSLSEYQINYSLNWEASNQIGGVSFRSDEWEPFFAQWVFDRTQVRDLELRHNNHINTGKLTGAFPVGEAQSFLEIFGPAPFVGDIAEVRIYKNLAPEFEPRIRRELALLYPTLDIPVDRSMSSFSLENALVDDLGQILFIEAE